MFEPCRLCGSPAKTQQGLTCHFRLKHPGESANADREVEGNYSLDDGLPEYRPGPAMMPVAEVLEQILQSVAEMEDRLIRVEARFDDNDDLADRIDDVSSRATQRDLDFDQVQEDIGNLKANLGDTKDALNLAFGDIRAWIGKLEREMDNVQRAWDNQLLLAGAKLREPLSAAGEKRS